MNAQLGIVGLAVMGRNLALNVLDRGYAVAAYNRRPEPAREAAAQSGGRLVVAESYEALVSALERPRRVLLMVKAGEAVDRVLEALEPLLDDDDIVIDGGNSWYQDTRRREQACRARKLRYVGMGVSGGESGARLGPSLMPGGSKAAYEAIRPILESIAARTDSGPCVTYCGPDGAGHFVKMVHNGIEYADMQFIAEAYHVLREVGGLPPPALREVFTEWNAGPLESYLIEITGDIFGVRDPRGGGWLVDKVLDKAGQKGTGRWTAQVALELGVPVPSIAAAIDARVLSSMKDERVAASRILRGPAPREHAVERDRLLAQVHGALHAAKVIAYAQGMHLIAAASTQYGWSVDLKEVARIWKGGCIIRARFLDVIMRAFERAPDLGNLLLDDAVRQSVVRDQAALREVLHLAQHQGLPVGGMSSALTYYDTYRAAQLPQNLIQAQRDAFGAHTYQRADDPRGDFIHTDWL